MFQTIDAKSNELLTSIIKWQLEEMKIGYLYVYDYSDTVGHVRFSNFNTNNDPFFISASCQ